MRTIEFDVQVVDVTTNEQYQEMARLLAEEWPGITVTAQRCVVPGRKEDGSYGSYYQPHIATDFGPCLRCSSSWRMSHVVLRRAERCGWMVCHRGVWLHRDREGFFETLFRDCMAHELAR
jgi:hypothetical protein